MYLTSRPSFAASLFCAVVGSFLAVPDQALAQKKAKDYSGFAFDVDKRKKTKSKLTQRLSYSGDFGIGYLSEKNLKLYDNDTDLTLQVFGGLGLAFKLDIGENVVGFAHVDLSKKYKSTHLKDYGGATKFRIKEAHLSFSLSDEQTLSIGRLRFSEPRRWGMDVAADGIHLGQKTADKGWEIALFRDAFRGRGTYALAHAQRYSKTSVGGAYGLFEHLDGKNRLHLAGYFATQSKLASTYDFYGAAVFGDAANGHVSGFAFDANLIRKFPTRRWMPQLALGLAVGSPGYQQPDIRSNKARDNGQAQFHRFGTVFQPDLSNLAVATVGLGLRPSREFSVDLRAHAYAQVDASTIAPIARIRGQTTGQSGFVGHELSIVGAWRPNKKSKFEFGAGVFKPGRAYTDRSVAKRVYLRVTRYF